MGELDHLIPEPSGDLTSLGFASQTSQEERANLEAGMESTEEAISDEVPSEQSMPAEVEERVETAPAEVPSEPEAEAEQPQSDLERYRKSLEQPQEAAPQQEESELSRLRQQVSRLEGELKARAEQLDRAITGQQEAKPEAKKSPALDPAVISMLHRIQEEAPEKLPEALATVADYVAEQKVESRVSDINKRIEDFERRSSQNEQTLQFRQMFNSGLDQAKESLGGVYAEVVEDYSKNRENSLLFRKLVDNPLLLNSPVDAVKAVGADIQLWNQVGSKQAPVEQKRAGGSSQTAVSGSASERGISLNEPKPEGPSEAEVLFESLKGAHTPSLPWD